MDRPWGAFKYDVTAVDGGGCWSQCDGSVTRGEGGRQHQTS
jgi:hypothetical protein